MQEKSKKPDIRRGTWADRHKLKDFSPDDSKMSTVLTKIAEPYLLELPPDASLDDIRNVFLVAGVACAYAELPPDKQAEMFNRVVETAPPDQPDIVNAYMQKVWVMADRKKQLFPDDHRIPQDIEVVEDANGSPRVTCSYRVYDVSADSAKPGRRRETRTFTDAPPDPCDV